MAQSCESNREGGGLYLNRGILFKVGGGELVDDFFAGDVGSEMVQQQSCGRGLYLHDGRGLRAGAQGQGHDGRGMRAGAGTFMRAACRTGSSSAAAASTQLVTASASWPTMLRSASSA